MRKGAGGGGGAQRGKEACQSLWRLPMCTFLDVKIQHACQSFHGTLKGNNFVHSGHALNKGEESAWDA